MILVLICCIITKDISESWETMIENRDDTVNEIDLQKLFMAVLSKIRFVIAITIVSGIIFGLVSEFLIKDVYQTNVSLYVNNNKDAVSQNLDAGDINAATMLVSTYVHLINSNAVLDDVVNSMDLDYKTEDISKMINVSAIEDTQMLILTVSNTNPDHAYIIANAIADTAPSKITEIMDGSTVKVVDYALKPEKPVYPNTIKNIILGLFLGAVLGVGVAVISEMLDNSIKSEEDIARLIPDIPVIGVIPEIIVKNTEESRG